MSATVTYKGETLTTATNQTRTLDTAGTYLEDDITITDATTIPTGTKNISITANGTTTHDVVGYASASVTANVPNSYSAGDEGKVVSSGALVSQTAHADVTPTTSDQTIDTTTNNSIKVKGDADLVAGNIKKDVDIFGVTGSYEGGGGGSWIKNDGKTHLHVCIDSDYFKNTNLRFAQSIASGNTIDWGDNTSPTVPTNTSGAWIQHTYATKGEYDITITNTSGYFWFGDESTTKGYIFGDGVNNSSAERYKHFASILRKAELGKGFNISKARQFAACVLLTDVYVNTKPDQSTIGTRLFEGDTALQIVDGASGVFDSITAAGQAVFSNCISLANSFIPPNLTSIPQNYNAGNSNTYNAMNLIEIPEGVTSIGGAAFRYSRSAPEVTIPSTVASIDSQVFDGCNGLHAVHVKPTSPPSLSNSNAFPITNSNNVYAQVMYVPYSVDHSVLATYQGASNWSAYSSYMQEEPQ